MENRKTSFTRHACVVVILVALSLLLQSCALFALDAAIRKNKGSSSFNTRATATEYAMSFNNTIANAGQISLDADNDVVGLLSVLDEHWYAFRTDRLGKVRIRFDSDCTHDDRRICYRVFLCDADEGANGWHVIGQSSVSASKGALVPNACVVSEGTHYVRVVPGDNAFCGSSYSFSVLFDHDAHELNDQAADATSIGIGQPIAGSLFSAEDEDWYYFSVSDPCAVRIEFDHDAELPSSVFWRCGIFCPEPVSRPFVLFDICGDRKKHTSDLIRLGPGAYYVKVFKGEKEHSYSNYVLGISEHGCEDGFRRDFKASDSDIKQYHPSYVRAEKDVFSELGRAGR